MAPRQTPIKWRKSKNPVRPPPPTPSRAELAPVPTCIRKELGSSDRISSTSFLLSHRNLVQTRAESSLLELCRVQPRFMNVSHNYHEWIEDVARCSPLHLVVIFRILTSESLLSSGIHLQTTETLCNNISRHFFNQRATGSYNICVHLCFLWETSSSTFGIINII